MLASIVIPAYKPYSLLKSCVESIYENTEESLIEIIVVLNGSDQESLESLPKDFPNVKFVWNKDPLGFTKAANIGFLLVENPITIICNTDIKILNFWPKTFWLYHLIKPFFNTKVGISGVGIGSTDWGKFFPFYFTAIRTQLFKEIGYLDLDFSPGYGEDIDFCVRTVNAGYDLYPVDNDTVVENDRYVSGFPLYHKGEGSFTDPDERRKYLENSDRILTRKYNKNNGT
jgi:GT2 family glycosyltransferase